jgi:predicted nuclease of predicted toxin-antitoxin system
LRWIADENIPKTSIQSLRDAGFEVLSVAEYKPGLTDLEVLELARQNGYGLLTFDRDFGELIFRKQHPAPLAVVYFRFIPSSPDEAAMVMMSLISSLDVFEGQFIVLDRDSYRKRPLPNLP